MERLHRYLPWTKRLDRYMFHEMVVPFLIGQAAVVLMLTGTVLYNNADTFLSYGIPAAGVVKIAFYFVPYLVNLTMPVAMAVAASLSVSRLARDSEITVMRAAGISLRRVFLPVGIAGVLLSMADFYFGEHVVPWANRRYETTMADLSRSIRFLAPKENQIVESPDGRYRAEIRRMQAMRDHTELYGVTIWVDQPGADEPMTILADRADYRGGVWTLYDARSHRYSDHGERDQFMRAKTATVAFQIPERAFNLIYLQLPLYSATATSSFRELGERLALERKGGWVNSRDLLDYHFKLSVPFSCLVFALVCPPLALRFARSGSFMGVLLSIILVFVYWNTLLAAKIVGAKYPNILPPILAGWGQNVLFSAIGIYFLWRGE